MMRRERKRVERLAAASLESLLNAIDANDAQTGGHVRRVAQYALILADARRVDPRARAAVERVALFHDIGKIQEALFDITHDDDTLSPQERRLIATHPARGAEVLAPLSFFYPDLGEGVLSHHERWDGTGYPRRLRGFEIPLAARIVSIADTFDAITHQRRYGHARSASAAARVIRTEAGKQFDPDLAELFLSPEVFAEIRRSARGAASPGSVRQSKASRSGREQRPTSASAPDVPFRWRSTKSEATSSSDAS
jgi:HD-GYP domain-containing protein (c-di-GMP phosphodiesterase class II)